MSELKTVALAYKPNVGEVRSVAAETVVRIVRNLSHDEALQAAPSFFKMIMGQVPAGIQVFFAEHEDVSN